MKISRTFQCKKVLWTSIVVMLLASVTMVTMVTVSSASPETKLYMDPDEITGKKRIYIMVDDANDTFAWEFRLSWDPALLNLTAIWEDLFLTREEGYKTDINWAPSSFDEANAAGEILIGCSLIQEENQPPVPWASGDGKLCSVGFNVVAGASGSCVIDLFDTRLFDHIEMGSPAPTSYPNENCFFYNTETHDIGVTAVTAPSKVQIGYPAIVSVTVVNEGTSTETFDIDLYDDTTLIGSTTVTNLAGFGTFATKTFSLSTATAHVYNLVASVDPVTNETDTNDNTLIDGTVAVVPPDIAVLSVVPLIPELDSFKGPFYVFGVTLTTVTVRNEGPGYSGYFDLIVLANGVGVSSYKAQYGVYLILPPETQVSIPLAWVIYGKPAGTYYLTGYATPVTGEVDKADNMKTMGSVIVTPPSTFAKLIDWQLKVNGKSGTGIGHKSTVNAVNLFEARVGNATQNLVVKAMFEVKNPGGMVLARVWSPAANVTVGQVLILTGESFSTILNATIQSWESPPYPCLLYITAYLYYGQVYPIIAGGFSQTLTLRVDMKPQG